MRNAFAEELTALGGTDPRVVMLSGDIGNKLFDKFRAAHGARFFNCGVAEANMMGVAAGLAMSGLRPIAYTITPFVTTRCLEQIRTDVCYHEAPVTIEEHSLIGGFGAAVSEWITDNRVSAPAFLRFGTPDAFFKLSGEQEFAREKLGLTSEHVADRILRALA